ncbi:MAG: cytochrome c551/c552 [Arenicella sp.]
MLTGFGGDPLLHGRSTDKHDIKSPIDIFSFIQHVIYHYQEFRQLPSLGLIHRPKPRHLNVAKSLPQWLCSEAHNPATGATCWFSADGENVQRPLEGKQVPSPTAAIDARYWNSPSEVSSHGCGNCHDNDPFMHSPFIGQVWQNVPENPMGAYYHVAPELGFWTWPTTMMNFRDNSCLGCHRIGIETTCPSLTNSLTGFDIPEGADQEASSFPLSQGMPPNHSLTKNEWTGSMRKVSVISVLVAKFIR